MQVDVSLGCYSSDKFPIKLSSPKPFPEPQLACAWLTHPHLAHGWTVHGELCQLCPQARGGKAAQFPVFLVRAPPLTVAIHCCYLPPCLMGQTCLWTACCSSDGPLPLSSSTPPPPLHRLPHSPHLPTERPIAPGQVKSRNLKKAYFLIYKNGLFPNKKWQIPINSINLPKAKGQGFCPNVGFLSGHSGSKGNPIHEFLAQHQSAGMSKNFQGVRLNV